MHGSSPNSSGVAPARPQGWAKAATLIAVATASTLILTKFIAWLITGSATVLGSLADSGLDLLGSMIAFGAVRYASAPADQDHRFGHDKAEPVASALQVVIITASAVFVLVESVRRFITPEALHQGELALGAMVLSLVLSSGLVAFQSYAMRKSDSLVIEGDRAHYIGDILANFGGIIAIYLSIRFGWLRADAIAGAVAGIFLLHAAYSIVRKAIPQLMDEELSPSKREQIRSIVMADEDVRGLHALRTRKAGSRVFILFHLELDPQMRLDEAHVVADRVELALLKEFPGADIMVHQDPHGLVEPHDRYGNRLPE